jgi:hypothetical protein
MVGLAASLVEFERTLTRARVAVASHFRPGIEEAATRSRLDQVGLVPSDEVVEWFGWHDGAGDPYGDIRKCELAPGVYFFDLETLCQEYLDTRRDFAVATQNLPAPWSDPSRLWSPSWFPLARLDAGALAADLAGGPARTSPIHAGWFDAGPEYKAHPQWPTLDALVQELTRRYEEGTYEVDPDGLVRGPDVDWDLRKRP